MGRGSFPRPIGAVLETMQEIRTEEPETAEFRKEAVSGS